MGAEKLPQIKVQIGGRYRTVGNYTAHVIRKIKSTNDAEWLAIVDHGYFESPIQVNIHGVYLERALHGGPSVYNFIEELPE